LSEKGGVGEIFQVVLFHWNLRIFEDQFEVVFDVFTIDVENSFGHILIIAIKKPDGSMLFNPSFETKIEAGDTVIAVGEDSNLQKFEKILES